MAFTEKIRLVFDINDKAAVGSFGRIGSSIRDAEGARGKFDAGLKSTGSFLKANMAEAAMAAGAALVAFGVASVKAFQDTALESGKLSAALGIDVESASRLKEVAGDLGVDLGTLQGAMQRMNVAAADGVIDVTGFGNAVVLAAGGTTDSYQTFINAATAIGAIEDSTARAKAAQATFGRSYGEIAELMEMDADELRTALGEVSDEQVIDQGELTKARDFRAALDGLTDIVGRLQLAVGEQLVPHLTELGTLAEDISESPIIGWAVGVSEALDKISLDLGDVVGGFENMKLAYDVTFGEEVTKRGMAFEGAVKNADKATGDLGLSFTTTDRSAKDFADEVKRADEKLRDAEDAIRDADDALSTLRGNLDQRDALRNMNESLGALFIAASSADTSMDDLAVATDDAILAVAEFVEGAKNIPPEVKTSLFAELDAGNLEAVQLYIDGLARGVELPIRPRVVGAGASLIAIGSGGAIPRFDDGGVMPGPKGEHNLALVAGGETILPTHKGPGAGSSSGGNTTINITTNADPNSVVNATRRFSRRNGPGL